jgi:ribose transport system substrate-binding protein
LKKRRKKRRRKHRKKHKNREQERRFMGLKAIALQDYGKTQGLVVLDGYEIGYKSVEEIAKKIKNRLYKMESHETEVKIMDQDTKLLDDEIERFLYSYE